MTKAELMAMLASYPDDVEIWMEVDAGIAPVGGAEPYQLDGRTVIMLDPGVE